jgi:Phage capsid protein
MSVNLTSVAVTEFDAQVKAAYQKAGQLRRAVRVRTGVVGSTARFRRYAKGIATPRVPQTDVTPMNTLYAEATATLADWNAPEYTDVFDQASTNVSEREVVATNIAAAIGRREDQLILDQLDTANGAPNIDTNVGGASTGLNMAKLRRAMRLLNQRGVPGMDRYFIHHSRGLEDLLGTTEATSSDFNTVKTLAHGEINKFLKFEFIEIEDRDEGGLPLAATLRTNYAFHKQAMALAIGLDFRTEVNYVAEKTSWLANGLFKAGSAVVDANGVIEVQTTET